MIAGPIRRLTRIVQAIAGGKTDEAVPYTAWKDEIGRMAASVETLREVMRQTFIQAQMIEQLPVGVMTAEPAGDFRITYVNAEARHILQSVQDVAGGAGRQAGRPADRRFIPIRAPARPDRRSGQPAASRADQAGSGDAGPADQRDLRPRRRLRGAVADMAQWYRTGPAGAAVRAERRRHRRTVAVSADGMRQAASDMRQSAIAAGERTLAVSAASNQASSSVSTAAAGAEQVAAVGRRNRPSGRASPPRSPARAVSEAQATDASVSS